MQVTIENKLNNPLLQRTEVEGSLSFEGAIPSNMELQQELAKQLSKDAQLIVVKKLESRFSGSVADFKAVAYANPEAKQKAERMTKHIRKRMAEEAKKKAEEKARKEAEEAKKKAEEEAKKAAEEAKAAEQPKEDKEGEQ